MVKIAVRLDDITPDMDWEKFLAFKEILDTYKIKPLIGIVPENKDPLLHGSSKGAPTDFWAYVNTLQKDGWCVAMHGYDHIYSTKKGGLFPLNRFSEFAGVPYEEQFKDLKNGKELLERHGINTDIFMAPAHSYDRNTLRALKELGFRALTDGFGKSPYCFRGLHFYPISFLLKRTLEQADGFSTLVVHTGTIDRLEPYRNFFEKENVQWISYETMLQQPVVKQTYLAHIKEYLMAYLKGAVGRLGQLRKRG